MPIASRNRREAVDGLLLLDKPAGLTSNRALQQVRRLLGARKGGHTGSLDPAATGMLPLCFGEATKVCSFLLDADKTYRVTARLGVATNTGDADGDVTESVAVPDLSPEDWRAVLARFEGESKQVPPMYSALKVEGKRLYELARRGETVDREPRTLRIDSIELLESAGPRLVFRVRCSKGTYVRTLVEDIARQAGTVAHTARLHRERVAHFDPGAMVGLAEAEALVAEGGVAELRKRLLPPDQALAGLPDVSLDPESGRRFASGQAVSGGPGVSAGLVRVYGSGDEFLGVGQLAGNGRLAPRRVFHSGEKNP